MMQLLSHLIRKGLDVVKSIFLPLPFPLDRNHICNKYAQFKQDRRKARQESGGVQRITVEHYDWALTNVDRFLVKQSFDIKLLPESILYEFDAIYKQLKVEEGIDVVYHLGSHKDSYLKFLDKYRERVCDLLQDRYDKLKQDENSKMKDDLALKLAANRAEYLLRYWMWDFPPNPLPTITVIMDMVAALKSVPEALKEVI
jgi:hypothetical protein